MKSIRQLIGLLLLCCYLSSCDGHNSANLQMESASKPPVESAGMPPAESATKLPEKSANIDYPNVPEDAFIQLDSEPRLRSPMVTVISETTQHYTIYFRNSMNKESVESVLTKQLNEQIPYTLSPKLAFTWSNDQELHLTAELPAISKAVYPLTGYKLNTGGALTKDNKPLEKPGVLGAMVTKPKQIWRVSEDGKIRQKISDFLEPYWFNSMLRDGRYALAFRFTDYCECDARYVQLYSIYDFAANKLVSYPVTLTANYQGDGNFVADTRGFFYNAAKAKGPIPDSGSAVKLNIQDFVYGASFSKDGNHLIMALGSAQKENDLHLAIYDIQTGTIHKINAAIPGYMRKSQLDSAPEPIIFQDDGVNITFALQKADHFEDINYIYNWKSRQIQEWKPNGKPVYPQDIFSTDGRFRYAIGDGIYDNKLQIASNKIVTSTGLWLNGTHNYMFTDFDQNQPQQSLDRTQIKRFNADSKTIDTIISKMNVESTMIGESSDGKWIYIATISDLH